MSRHALRVLLVTLCLALLVPAPAHASEPGPYELRFTAGLGAYPRSAPDYEARTGNALPEGSLIYPTCWSHGGQLTNPYGYTTDIWILDANDHWWSEAWLETESFGEPDGLDECDASAPLHGMVNEPIKYHGNSNLNYWSPAPMAYALYDHYLWGEGEDAVLDGWRVGAAPGFQEHVLGMSIGEFGNWTPPNGSDLQLAVGTFFVSRETERCWAMYDYYDFEPNVPSDTLDVRGYAKMFADLVGYWPFWGYSLAGAKAFNVNSSGCF